MSVNTYSSISAKILCWFSKALCALPIAVAFWGVESNRAWAVEVSMNQQVVLSAQKIKDDAHVEKPRIIPTIASPEAIGEVRQVSMAALSGMPLAEQPTAMVGAGIDRLAAAPRLIKEQLAQAHLASDLLPIGRISVIPSEGAIAQSTAPAESAPVKSGGSLDKSVTPETPGAPQPAKVSPIRPTTAVPKDSYSVNVEQYYYNWTDQLGNNGNQIVIPLTVTYSKGNFDLGLRTAYIKSQFNGNLILDGLVIGKRKGEVSTLSDTSVSLAYTLKKSAYPIRFNLDLNLPTGKATLRGDEKNAIMDGALVQQTRFGEGFNIAPGVSISHAFGQKDVLGLGLSHIIRGQFDPNGDVVNDEIKPGNETVATLQYQHSEKNWLAIGGLIYTNYGTTKRGGQDYYRSGDRLDVNGTLVVSPTVGQRIQLSGRYFTQGKNTVVNFFTGDLVKESANSNGNALYLSGDWGIATDPKQRGTLHLLADWLTVSANSYDRVNDLFNAGRNKVSLGLGYDYNFSPTTRASIQAKYFWLTDKATPVTQQDVRSNGINLYGTLNYSF